MRICLFYSGSPRIHLESAKAIKQEDSDSNFDLSSDGDEEWLPPIEEDKTKQIVSGMPFVIRMH